MYKFRRVPCLGKVVEEGGDVDKKLEHETTLRRICLHFTTEQASPPPDILVVLKGECGNVVLVALKSIRNVCAASSGIVLGGRLKLWEGIRNRLASL